MKKKEKKEVWTKYSEPYMLMPLITAHQRLMNTTADFLKGKHRTLDNGTGIGILAEILHERGHDSYGIDFNEEMARKAKERLGNNAKIYQADATKLPFDSDFFDGIASINVLYTIDDSRKFLEEAYRVTKPSGTFILNGLRPNYQKCLTRLEKTIVEDITKLVQKEDLPPEAITTVEEGIKMGRELARGAKTYIEMEELCKQLIETGFSKINYSDDNIYAGIGPYVVAEK